MVPFLSRIFDNYLQQIYMHRKKEGVFLFIDESKKVKVRSVFIQPEKWLMDKMNERQSVLFINPKELNLHPIQRFLCEPNFLRDMKTCVIEEKSQLDLSQFNKNFQHFVAFNMTNDEKRTLKKLIHTAIRFRTDAIILPDLDKEAAYHLVQAIHTGHVVVSNLNGTSLEEAFRLIPKELVFKNDYGFDYFAVTDTHGSIQKIYEKKQAPDTNYYQLVYSIL